MPKVYLSSTLLDFKKERQAVSDWLIAAGHQPVHSYVATGETVRASCLADIAECDFVVLILGHRYDFIPPDNNPEQLSITHLEFRETRRLNKTCLAFLRTSVPDTTLSDLRNATLCARLFGFHDEAGAAVRPAEFKTLTEFTSAFTAAIHRHVSRLLDKRDAEAQQHQQRAVALESELRAVRENAITRVLDSATPGRPDELASRARQALLQGETALAEQLLRQQEDQAANAAADKRREAAELAREIAALAVGRDSQAALAAFTRVAHYLPDDVWTHIQLGDAEATVGNSAEALASYRHAHDVAEARLAGDPANAEWQRDLMVSHIKLAGASGDTSHYRRALAIAEAMQAKGTLAPRDAGTVEKLKQLAAE